MTEEIIEMSESERDETQSEEENPENSKKKKRKREIIKKTIKEDSGLSLLKVVGTALTAVSMALISARLTGFVNSLILVALVSIGSAIMTEFYRVILSLTSMSAKKVVLPIVKINPDGTTKSIEIESTENESDEKIDKVENAIKSEKSEKEFTNNSQNDVSFFKHIKNYFKRSPLMKMALLFAVISLLTIGVNYFITSQMSDGKTVEHTTTTVHKTEQERLSDQEKEAIIDSAVNESKNQPGDRDYSSRNSDENNSTEKESKNNTNNKESQQTDSKNTPEKSSDDNSNDDNSTTHTKETIVKENPTNTDDLATQINDLKKENEDLQKQLKELKKSSGKTSSSSSNNNDDELIKSLQSQIRTLNNTIDILQKQMDELETKLEQQANSGSSQSINPESAQSVK